MKKDTKTGRFLRTIQQWSPENMNDGYVDNRGRFRVFYPNHNRSY